jgi:DNA-directed RNA polymerase subunit RPC12/RpoP
VRNMREFFDIERIITANKRTIDCPHCNVRSLHTIIMDIPDYDTTIILKGDDGKNYISYVKMNHMIYKCVNCSKDTYFLIRRSSEAKEKAITGTILRAKSPAEIIHQYPIYSPSLHPSVNEDVKRATIEAENCFSVRAFNACGVMTRRAMHSLCSEKGAQGRDLHEQLKYLKDNNLITPDLWEWAEELRIVGRSGAHPEWEDVSEEDAEYALKFLREIIRYVYINPAERATRRLKETKRKKE